MSVFERVLVPLLPQFHYRSPRAALLLRRGIETRHVRMLAQHLRHHPLQHAHAVAVDDAHAAGGGHHGAVQEFVDGVVRLFRPLPDHVDFLVYRRQLRRRLVAYVLRQLPRPAAFGQHLDHIVDRDLHLHEADLHFEFAVAQNAAHARRVADVLQAQARALCDAQRLYAILPGIVLGGEHRGLKILAEFALGFGDAALRVLIGLAPVAALRDLADRVLRLLLEFGQRLIGAALQFLDLGGLALLPLAGDFLLAAVQFDDLLAQADFQRLRLFDAVVQFAEEAGNIAFAEIGRAH